MKIDNVLVGKAIARLREQRGLTQTQLNELVGMKTIQHIEQGRNAVSLTCLNKIASALDIPAACIGLLGSEIDEKDRVLSSLHALLETTLSTDDTTKPRKNPKSSGKRKPPFDKTQHRETKSRREPKGKADSTAKRKQKKKPETV